MDYLNIIRKHNISLTPLIKDGVPDRWTASFKNGSADGSTPEIAISNLLTTRTMINYPKIEFTKGISMAETKHYDIGHVTYANGEKSKFVNVYHNDGIIQIHIIGDDIHIYREVK